MLILTGKCLRFLPGLPTLQEALLLDEFFSFIRLTSSIVLSLCEKRKRKMWQSPWINDSWETRQGHSYWSASTKELQRLLKLSHRDPPVPPDPVFGNHRSNALNNFNALDLWSVSVHYTHKKKREIQFLFYHLIAWKPIRQKQSESLDGHYYQDLHRVFSSLNMTLKDCSSDKTDKKL